MFVDCSRTRVSPYECPVRRLRREPSGRCHRRRCRARGDILWSNHPDFCDCCRRIPQDAYEDRRHRAGRRQRFPQCCKKQNTRRRRCCSRHRTAREPPPCHRHSTQHLQAPQVPACNFPCNRRRSRCWRHRIPQEQKECRRHSRMWLRPCCPQWCRPPSSRHHGRYCRRRTARHCLEQNLRRSGMHNPCCIGQARSRHCSDRHRTALRDPGCHHRTRQDIRGLRCTYLPLVPPRSDIRFPSTPCVHRVHTKARDHTGWHQKRVLPRKLFPGTPCACFRHCTRRTDRMHCFLFPASSRRHSPGIRCAPRNRCSRCRHSPLDRQRSRRRHFHTPCAIAARIQGRDRSPLDRDRGEQHRHR